MKTAIFLAMAIMPSVASGQSPARSTDIGRFIVTRVIADPALDNQQARYRNDDPRFVGRSIDIARDRVSLDISTCAHVNRRWGRSSVAAHLKERLDSHSLTRNQRTLREMRIPSAAAGPIQIVDYTCMDSDHGPTRSFGRNWSNASSFPLSGGQRGLLWQGEIVLILTPAARAAPAKPSFDCRRAKTPAAKAICADPALAGWDRSVSMAYNLLRNGGGPDDNAPIDDPAALVDSQRRWIAMRDRCGADRQCLSDGMAERTDALMRRQF